MARSFLFLQGPHGPFFRQLGQKLVAEGHHVVRINLNGGDRIDWFGSLTQDFTGTHKAWPQYVARVMEREEVTDIVLYGDCRQAHAEAIRQARKRHIRIFAFEEGYVRPDWVTLEEGGVNGHSDLPKEADWYLEQAESTPKPPAEKVGPTMRWIVFYCLRYYLFKAIYWHRFRYFIRHRPYRPAQELLLWVSHLIRLPLLKRRDAKRLVQLKKRNRPYFLLGLQLDSDAQVRCHSPFLSMAEFLNHVLRSFARHAPEEALLVIKKHPHDPNGVAYETLAMLESHALNIRERVIFLQTGPLPELVRGSSGVIINNSTVGSSSLHHGAPTIALGEAVYDMDGMTWQGGLDRFWTEATKPDATLVEAFRRVLLSSVLVNGGFYNPHGRRLLLSQVVEQMQPATAKESPEHTGADVVPIHRGVRR